MSEFRALSTETVNPQYQDLDTWDTPHLVQALVEDQLGAVEAVRRAIGPIAQAADRASRRLRQGGRLIYAGAGTSGRLGFLDSAELPPTFSWPPERSLVCIAGGERAIRQAVEGAEDDLEAGRRDFLAHRPTAQDVVIALAASGTTPYPQGVLLAAGEVGALRIGIANNPDTPVLRLSEVAIALETGPEVISGSTRLKAGTAQKIALNALSSAIMVRLGKVYGNLMVDLQATNTKLLARAVRLTIAATGASEEAAKAALEASGWQVKTAIVMLRKGLNPEAAREVLSRVDGDVRLALR